MAPKFENICGLLGAPKFGNVCGLLGAPKSGNVNDLRGFKICKTLHRLGVQILRKILRLSETIDLC